MREEIRALLRKQGYKIVGSHSAVKPCTWLRKSLLNKGYCYKQKFYGIQSHLCLQCTPSVTFCQNRCLFCWRPIEFTSGFIMKECDDPEEIVEGMIKAQREFLIGYNKFERVNEKKLKEANNPKHAAISLAGEPTIYPRISELVKEFHKRKMTTFIVTNGLNPNVLESMEELPTQLYFTLAAPDKETYQKTCNPLILDFWERINKTIEVFPKLKTRKVIRLTLVRELNMISPEEYAKLIKKADPHFVEAKAFMSVGFARRRLPYESMPLHSEIKEFAQKLAKELGWQIIDEKEDSRVVLIAREDYSWRRNLDPYQNL